MDHDPLQEVWQVIRDGNCTVVTVRMFDRQPNLARVLLISALGTGQTVKVVPNGDPYVLALAVDFVEEFAAGHGLVVDWTDTPATLDASFFIAGAAA